MLVEAQEAAAIPLPLHSHQQLLVESGRVVLRPDHRENDPTRNLPQRQRSKKGHLPVARQLEWCPHALRMESLGRRNPRQGQTL